MCSERFCALITQRQQVPKVGKTSGRVDHPMPTLLLALGAAFFAEYFVAKKPSSSLALEMFVIARQQFSPIFDLFDHSEDRPKF